LLHVKCFQNYTKVAYNFHAITRLVDICYSCIQKSFRTAGKFQCNNQVCCSFAHKILISNSRSLTISFSDQLRLDAPYTFLIFSISISWTKRQASEERKTFKLDLPKTIKSHLPGYCTKGFNYSRPKSVAVVVRCKYNLRCPRHLKVL
jgi:hypothetical protein